MTTRPLPPHFILFCRDVRDALEAGRKHRPAWFSYHGGLCWNYQLWLGERLEGNGMKPEEVMAAIARAARTLGEYLNERYGCGGYPFNGGDCYDYSNEVEAGTAYDNAARRAFVYEIAALDDKA